MATQLATNDPNDVGPILISPATTVCHTTATHAMAAIATVPIAAATGADPTVWLRSVLVMAANPGKALVILVAALRDQVEVVVGDVDHVDAARVGRVRVEQR